MPYASRTASTTGSMSCHHGVSTATSGSRPSTTPPGPHRTSAARRGGVSDSGDDIRGSVPSTHDRDAARHRAPRDHDRGRLGCRHGPRPGAGAGPPHQPDRRHPPRGRRGAARDAEAVGHPRRIDRRPRRLRDDQRQHPGADRRRRRRAVLPVEAPHRRRPPAPGLRACGDRRRRRVRPRPARTRGSCTRAARRAPRPRTSPRTRTTSPTASRTRAASCGARTSSPTRSTGIRQSPSRQIVKGRSSRRAVATHRRSSSATTPASRSDRRREHDRVRQGEPARCTDARGGSCDRVGHRSNLELPEEAEEPVRDRDGGRTQAHRTHEDLGHRDRGDHARVARLGDPAIEQPRRRQRSQARRRRGRR